MMFEYTEDVSGIAILRGAEGDEDEGDREEEGGAEGQEEASEEWEEGIVGVGERADKGTRVRRRNTVRRISDAREMQRSGKMTR